MTRLNFNLSIIFTISVSLILYLFFYDVTNKSYVSSPETVKSRDIEVHLELEGETQKLFGRFRRSIATPYHANIYFNSDIAFTRIKIKEFIITSSITKSVYVYVAPNGPLESLEFEPIEFGVEANYYSEEALDIPFDQKDILTAVLSFETDISGLVENHHVEFNLIPRVKKDKRLLLPNEARELLKEID